MKQYLDIGNSRLEEENEILIIKPRPGKKTGSLKIEKDTNFVGTVDFANVTNVNFDQSRVTGLTIGANTPNLEFHGGAPSDNYNIIEVQGGIPSDNYSDIILDGGSP